MKGPKGRRAGPPALVVKLWIGQIRSLANQWAERKGIKDQPIEALAKATGLSRALLFRYAASDPETKPVTPSMQNLILIAHVLEQPLNAIASWHVVDSETGEIVGTSDQRSIRRETSG